MRGSLGRPWFGAHRYGIGTSGPITWQGWVVVGLMAVAFFLECWLIHGHTQTVAVWVTAIIAGVICMLKTEGGWRWRWGRSND